LVAWCALLLGLRQLRKLYRAQLPVAEWWQSPARRHFCGGALAVGLSPSR
jgi:hypothetical protein